MEAKTIKKTSIDYLTFMSVISAVAVVFLHTNGCYWSFSATARYWKTANVIDCVLYFAVPIFFMSTGITLMDFHERMTLPQYFSRRVQKTVLPFLAWSFIGIFWSVYIGNLPLDRITPKYLYQSVTGTSVVSIFWFFTPLFVIYLCMPLFAAVEKSRRKTVFTYLVVAGFLLNILVPFLKTVFENKINMPYNLPVVSGALLWPLLGWLLHNSVLNKKQKGLIYALALLGLALHMGGTYVLSMKAGDVVRTYKGYQNVPSVLYAVGAFVLLRDLGSRIMQTRAKKFFVWMASYTFPIYLMQFLFLQKLPQLSFVDTRSLVYRLGAPFFIIPAIMAITWCVRKIPGLRRILP